MSAELLDQLPESTRDKAGKSLIKETEAKISTLREFQLSGKFADDYNRFLEITDRDVNYKKATLNESADEMLKILEQILRSLIEDKEEGLRENYNEAEKMFYEDLPRAEIDTIKKLIEAYG